MVTENDDNSKSSEEYMIRLLQTIESLDSLMRDLRGEVSFLRDELTRLREKDAEHDLERKLLMKQIEGKNEDIRRLTDKMSGLLGKVDALTKVLEDKTHQLTNRNRGQFGTKTNRIIFNQDLIDN